MCLKNVEEEKELKQISDSCKSIIDIVKVSKLKEKLEQYELVRQERIYNMLDPKARELAGLTKEDYMYIIEHYEELILKYPNVKDVVRRRLDYIKSANIAKVVAVKGCNNCIELVSRKLDVNIDELCDKCKKIVKTYIYSSSNICNI